MDPSERLLNNDSGSEIPNDRRDTSKVSHDTIQGDSDFGSLVESENENVENNQELVVSLIQSPSNITMPDLFEGPTRDRIHTLVKARNYDNQDEVGDAWVFPIGWDKKNDAPAGQYEPRFLSNEIQTAKYTKMNFVPFNFFH